MRRAVYDLHGRPPAESGWQGGAVLSAHAAVTPVSEQPAIRHAGLAPP